MVDQRPNGGDDGQWIDLGPVEELSRQSLQVVRAGKTPLALVCSQIELALEKPGGGEDLGRVLGDVLRRVRHLARAVDALLRLSQAEEGLDRTQVLRLIGMSAEQAEQAGKKPLKAVLKELEYRNNALALEDGLLRLLTFQHHDPEALVEALRHPPFRPEPEPIDVLIDRVNRGGPDWLLNLSAYLVAAMNGTADRGEP